MRAGRHAVQNVAAVRTRERGPERLDDHLPADYRRPSLIQHPTGQREDLLPLLVAWSRKRGSGGIPTIDAASVCSPARAIRTGVAADTYDFLTLSERPADAWPAEPSYLCDHRTASPRHRLPRRSAMRRIPFHIPRPHGLAATGALLAIALLLASAVAVQAHRAARAQRAAERRVLHDHAAYAAAEFARRAAATLEAALITVQHFPTTALEQQPSGTPLPPLDAYRRAVREQDYWCECLDTADGFFLLRFDTGQMEMTGRQVDAGTEAWIREAVTAHARWIMHTPRDTAMNVFGETEGRGRRNRYQLRINRTTALLRPRSGGTEAALFTVIFDDRDQPRAAYGVVEDAAIFAVPVFRRVIERGTLLPASVMQGAPNDSVLRITVLGPGGTPLWRSAAAGPAATSAGEAFPRNFGDLRAHVELLPGGVGRLLRNEAPASPLPLLIGLLGTAVGVVAMAFVQLRRQYELARLRADFVAGVSHELRTPLTQLRMFSELLLSGRLRTDEERERSLRLIHREARRLAYLVDNVLEFSRSGRGSLGLSLRPADLSAAVEETVAGFAPLVAARGMKLRTEVEPGLMARLDRGGFRQILLNFLENAVKYGPPEQTVAVGAARAGDRVRVWVQDDGPGVPPSQRRRIWEPYYRLERDREGAAGGSGIGLSVVGELVKQHAGRAWVEDAPGGGARFVAEFPATQASEEVER